MQVDGSTYFIQLGLLPYELAGQLPLTNASCRVGSSVGSVVVVVGEVTPVGCESVKPL